MRRILRDLLFLKLGELENKNILVCQKRGLVVIDPLPCIGDPAYDAA
jgi:streptomycin 6-kinase